MAGVAWPGLDGGGGGRAGLDGRAGFLFFICYYFFVGCQKMHTATSLLRARQKAHGKRPLSDSCIPCALCRVLHTAKLFP